LPVKVVSDVTTVSLLVIVAAVVPVAAIVNVPAAPNGLLIVAIVYFDFLVGFGSSVACSSVGLLTALKSLPVVFLYAAASFNFSKQLPSSKQYSKLMLGLAFQIASMIRISYLLMGCSLVTSCLANL
jgi:hypothetical protein